MRQDKPYYIADPELDSLVSIFLKIILLFVVCFVFFIIQVETKLMWSTEILVLNGFLALCFQSKVRITETKALNCNFLI